jgi:hypothetical protein
MPIHQLRTAQVSLGLCLGLCAGQSLAEDAPLSAWKSRPETASAFSSLSSFQIIASQLSQIRAPFMEITTRHRPAGEIALRAASTIAGAMAGATIEAIGPNGAVATVSVVTLSPPGAENATTVHAVTLGGDGPLLVAATTRGVATSGNEGTAAYAVITGPEGAVFHAAGDLSDLRMRSRTGTWRRGRTAKPFYAWDLPRGGATVFSVFLRSLRGHVHETQEETLEIDLAETVSSARLPAISLSQILSLQTRSNGLQVGLGLSHEIARGLSLWTQVGLGLSQFQAESRMLNLASVDHVMASGVEALGSVRRTLPSGVLSIGMSQTFGDGDLISFYVSAEADQTPVLVESSDGPAVIGIASMRSVTVGLTVSFRF